MKPWPHQEYGVRETIAAIARGDRLVCLTSPTGGGKSWMIQELARTYLEKFRKVVIYTNRRLLVDQMSRVLTAAGLDHGVRAADHEDERHLLFQVSSMQTEQARVFRKQNWGLHEAELAIIDEAHIQKGETAQRIVAAHLEQGAAVVDVTATPLDMERSHQSLVVAGTTSELRRCGALVPCLHRGPDEPDLRNMKGIHAGVDLSTQQNVKAMMNPTIFGRVLEWFDTLNHERRPTILFAPGVQESIWFMEQFNEAGITAAHIDGQEVIINGKRERTSADARRVVLEASRRGDVVVLCNRYVLREGIDAPWLGHGIFATVFGSLQSYLQSGGRLLRAHTGLTHVTIQDHGGNWWRHGSLNADRDWFPGASSVMMAGLRDIQLRRGERAEPVRCPRCAMILMHGRCTCGWESAGQRSRPVIQIDGSMIELDGRIFMPRKIRVKPDSEAKWKQMYYRAKNGHMTFRQAEALFAQENYWQWPSHDLPLMPKNDIDFFRRVEDVPYENLKGK